MFEGGGQEIQEREKEFLHLLSCGVPIVVNNVRMQGDYNPEYFIHKYQGDECTVHDCQTGKQYTSSVDAFFETFGQRHPKANGVLKLKVGSSAVSRRLMLISS